MQLDACEIPRFCCPMVFPRHEVKGGYFDRGEVWFALAQRSVRSLSVKIFEQVEDISYLRCCTSPKIQGSSFGVSCQKFAEVN